MQTGGFSALYYKYIYIYIYAIKICSKEAIMTYWAKTNISVFTRSFERKPIQKPCIDH